MTKLWAVSSLTSGQPVPILGSLFRLTLIYNDGGAMGTNLGPPTYYLVTSLLILVCVSYYLYSNRERTKLSVPLAFIAGGALGNIIDRFRYGEVVDFLDVDFFDINLFGWQVDRWWTFNIADAAISLSILYLVYHLFIHKHPHTEQVDPGDSPSARDST